jgi:hypothetical protein
MAGTERVFYSFSDPGTGWAYANVSIEDAKLTKLTSVVTGDEKKAWYPF